MSSDDLTDRLSGPRIEQQLGEVVGTLRATVKSLEGLRITVDRLAERMAYKDDLERLRGDMQRELDGLKRESGQEKAKVDSLRQMIWLFTGGGIVVGYLLKFVDVARFFGGG
jgi:hypothetical protein